MAKDEEGKTQRLTNEEYRALKALSEDGRMPAAEVARKLGISRVTASRILSSLKQKGIKVVPDYYDGSLFAFVVVERGEGLPEGAEAYDLLDGSRMFVVKAHDLEEMEAKLSSIPNKKTYYVATRKLADRVVKAELVCDYCGGPIRGEPITFKRGRRTYYACCQNCYSGLRKKLGAE